jgi:hypothetical protein
MPTDWQMNDPSIDDQCWAYRRVRRIPDHYSPPDPITGQPKITNASLLYESDGMSVHLSELMGKHELRDVDLCDWSSHALARFTVGTVRLAGGGTIAAEDRDDPIAARGSSHGLVRTGNPPPDKAAWRRMRNELRLRTSIRSDRGADWSLIGLPA